MVKNILDTALENYQGEPEDEDIGENILKVIKHDIECLNIDYKLDDNKYHYDLAIGNLNDLIKSEGTAVEIIGRLINVMEEGMPDYYFSSDLIAEANDYIKSQEN